MARAIPDRLVRWFSAPWSARLRNSPRSSVVTSKNISKILRTGHPARGRVYRQSGGARPRRRVVRVEQPRLRYRRTAPGGVARKR